MYHVGEVGKLFDPVEREALGRRHGRGGLDPRETVVGLDEEQLELVVPGVAEARHGAQYGHAIAAAQVAEEVPSPEAHEAGQRRRAILSASALLHGARVKEITNRSAK